MQTILKRTKLMIAIAIAFQTAIQAQNFGKAITFNGTSNYITVPNTANYLETSSFTFECWAKRSTDVSRSGKDRLMMSVSSNGWGVLIENNKVKLTKVGVSECASKTAIADTFWHHIAVTHNGTIATFFIDGKADTSITYSNTFNSTGSYTIGSRGNSEFFAGTIDEVRVWNKVKSSADIAQQRCIVLNGLESNLRAYYKFNEGSGTTIIDSTSNANNGSITNGTNLWVNSTVQCSTSGLADGQIERKDIGIFALPNNQTIQIKIPTNFELSPSSAIQIHNSTGSLVYKASLNNEERDFSIQTKEFAQGMYIVNIYSERGMASNKIFIAE